MGNKGGDAGRPRAVRQLHQRSETCFKLLPLPLYRELSVTAPGSAWQAAITGKLLARGIRPYDGTDRLQGALARGGQKLTLEDRRGGRLDPRPDPGRRVGAARAGRRRAEPAGRTIFD